MTTSTLQAVEAGGCQEMFSSRLGQERQERRRGGQERRPPVLGVGGLRDRCKLSVHTAGQEKQEEWERQQEYGGKEEEKEEQQEEVRPGRKRSCRLTVHCEEEREDISPGALLTLSIRKQEQVRAGRRIRISLQF